MHTWAYRYEHMYINEIFILKILHLFSCLLGIFYLNNNLNFSRKNCLKTLKPLSCLSTDLASNLVFLFQLASDVISFCMQVYLDYPARAFVTLPLTVVVFSHFDSTLPSSFRGNALFHDV